MDKYITNFTTTEEFNASKSSLKRPHVSLTKDDMKVHYMPYDYSDRYLTFIALEDGTFQFTKAINYSIDGGTTWTSLAANTSTPTITNGNKIIWKATLTPNSSNFDGIGHFSSTDNFNVEGNIMSLLYGDNFAGQNNLTGKNFAFYGLFESCSKLINAKNLSLPVTTLVNNCYGYMFDGCTSLITSPELLSTTLASCCYEGMFSGCTSLITAPELPATTLANYCYNSMFSGCSSLTTAPELPATTLADTCYAAMFNGCSSLTTAPELPATTLADTCYAAMFNGCSSLTTAPELPATTLADSCYQNMFHDCTSLITAPELPATTLTNSCYSLMFTGCTNLNYIKAMFTTTPSSTYTYNWVNGVAATGTFVKNGAAEWDVTGVHGIPVGWTIINDYSQNYLTFEALENGTISFNIWKSMGTDMITSISYSTDNGETWTTTNNTNGKSEHLAINVDVNEGDRILWKGDAQQMGYYDEDEYGDYVSSFFSSDCEFDVEGNVMSLLYGDDFKGEDTLEYEGQFNHLFCDYDGDNVCKVVNTSNLTLLATTLTSGCYSNMFQWCTSLTTVPKLPATTLTSGCYNYMFFGCTSLTTAPELPATTLTEGCYGGMFDNCTSLTTAPELPATTLASYCYQSMFQGCTSLATVPELPATVLAPSSYSSMFQGCTSLATVPELPATVLAPSCYSSMFLGCASLTMAPELPATTLANACYQYMFRGCTSLTTAPQLPATTLVPNCYNNMFQGCTSLTTAPQLPATTLADYCYNSMFDSCTSLTTAPQLPATELVSACYSFMFNGCTNLNYIKAMFTTTPSASYTNSWVKNVASSGTFIKNSAATWTTTGANGVPTGWTVQTASS